MGSQEKRKQFALPADWNKDDYLSSLPDDCIGKIFSYLDGPLLDSVAFLSQRLLSAATHSMCDPVRRRIHSLRIKMERNMFIANRSEDGRDKYVLNVDEAHQEHGTRYVNGVEVSVNRMKANHEHIYMSNGCFRISSVSDIFIRNLERFVKRRFIDELRIESMYVSSTELSHFASIFHGNVRDLSIEEVTFTRMDSAEY
ncbi:hypothetical protein PFISCL1PPCAC_2913, partial [Pristionchus fissidentatus]